MGMPLHWGEGKGGDIEPEEVHISELKDTNVSCFKLLFFLFLSVSCSFLAPCMASSHSRRCIAASTGERAARTHPQRLIFP